jgi:hypothetical protein
VKLTPGRRRVLAYAGILHLAATPCYAHSFSTPYVLPIPYWIYVYGCGAALIATFAVLAFLASGPAGRENLQTGQLGKERRSVSLPSWIVGLLRAGAIGCLLLTIVTGFIGSDDPAANISMTLFWVYFLLLFGYLTILVGNLYAVVNPWERIVDWLERRTGIDLSTARLRYPQAFSYWPAFVVYLVLVWIELFFEPLPQTVSLLLITYSGLTFAGIFLFGKTAWFERADLFSLYFLLIGKVAPVDYIAPCNGKQWRVRIRAPFSGLVNERAQGTGMVLLVLFMLSSTAYDGIHDTQLWTAFFWKNSLLLLRSVSDIDINSAQSMLMGLFLTYRKVGLILFPFLYLTVYLMALFVAKLMTRIDVHVRVLALDFCYSLIPIAVAYNFTHYFTFAYGQLLQLPLLLTDPLGRGWNLLGLDVDWQYPVLQMGFIWHMQVAVILVGHIASVALAHRTAIRTFPTQVQTIVSQLPMLVLMVAYTTMGIWILSLPLG